VNVVEAALRRIASDLDRHHQPWALSARADLRALLAVASTEDLDLARTSLGLITRRGFHRERDLAAAFDQLLA
jgi:hypothetical protein